MKNFKEVDFNEFVGTLDGIAKTIPPAKTIRMMKRLSQGNEDDYKATDVVNLILSNSQTPEEAFIHVNRLTHMARNIDNNPAVQMGMSILPLSDDVNPDNPIGFIKEEEFEDIHKDQVESFGEEGGTLSTILTEYQKKENSSWKGAVLFFLKLIEADMD